MTLPLSPPPPPPPSLVDDCARKVQELTLTWDEVGDDLGRLKEGGNVAYGYLSQNSSGVISCEFSLGAYTDQPELLMTEATYDVMAGCSFGGSGSTVVTYNSADYEFQVQMRGGQLVVEAVQV